MSVPNGRVEVTWEQRSDKTGSRLYLLWVEAGGPPVLGSVRKGFGTRLITDGLACELDAEVTLEFDAMGVRCAVDVPLNETEGR